MPPSFFPAGGDVEGDAAGAPVTSGGPELPGSHGGDSAAGPPWAAFLGAK